MGADWQNAPFRCWMSVTSSGQIVVLQLSWVPDQGQRFEAPLTVHIRLLSRSNFARWWTASLLCFARACAGPDGSLTSAENELVPVCTRFSVSFIWTCPNICLISVQMTVESCCQGYNCATSTGRQQRERSLFNSFDAWKKKKKLKTNPLFSQRSFVVSSKVQHHGFIST